MSSRANEVLLEICLENGITPEVMELIKTWHSRANEQNDLIDFLKDPATIGKAVEGSMEKRAAVLRPSPTAIRTAVVYRTKARDVVDESERDNYLEGDQVQFELAVFTDGRVAQRWLVGKGSSVWWDSLEDLYRVHIYAHPDYGTRVEWSDGKMELL